MRHAIWVLLWLPLAGLAAGIDNWPGKANGLGAPHFNYSAASCGDFIRAQGGPQEGYYLGYLAGYVSGINSERKYGGNVLGKNNSKIEDFAIMVRNFCTENPTDRFHSGIYVSLKRFTPATWQNFQ